MKYRIEIDCDNAAFEFQPGIEIARILRGIANECERLAAPAVYTIRDINGNKVGKVSATK